MPDLYVWADDPVNCSMTLKGVRYKDAKDIQFVFAEGSAGEVGRAKATRSGTTASGQWAKAKGPEGDALWRLLQYYIEIDGVKHTYFAQDIYVYAKKITIEAKGEDGKPLVGALAVIKQQIPEKGPDGQLTGETTTLRHVRKTDDNGKIEYALSYPGEVDVSWQRPYVLVKWTKQEGTKYEATVKLLKLKARLATPRPPFNDKSKPYRQYVNMEPARNTPSYGNMLKVEVVGTSEYEGKEGEEIFLKAEYDSANSDRTPPDGGHAKGVTKDLKGKLDRRLVATFELPLGYAGGDRVKIKVGATAECNDDEVTVESWRRIHYELMGPQMLVTNGRLEEGTLADGTKGSDYNKTIKDWFKDRLGKGFVEYVCSKSHIYPDASIPPAMKVDGKPFGGTAGKKYFVFGKKRFTPAGVAFERTSDPLTVNVWLCEHAFSYAPGSTHAAWETDPSSDLKSATGTLVAPGLLFPKRLDEGDDSVIDARWEAVVDAVATPDHPGVGQGGDIPATWFDFTKGPYTLGITLQGTAATLVGPAGPAKCPIRIKLKWFTYYEINGNAGEGKQTMVVDRPDKPIACTICHELGHSMGMAVFESNAKGRKAPPPAGLAYPKTVLEPGGDVYDDTHGHAGAHCANGCPDRPVGGAAFSFKGKEGTCIMFGSGGDEEEPKRQNFCAGCLKQIKGRRIENIKWDWSAADPTKL